MNADDGHMEWGWGDNALQSLNVPLLSIVIVLDAQVVPSSIFL